jgi:hypothetical protein
MRQGQSLVRHVIECDVVNPFLGNSQDGSLDLHSVTVVENGPTKGSDNVHEKVTMMKYTP